MQIFPRQLFLPSRKWVKELHLLELLLASQSSSQQNSQPQRTLQPWDSCTSVSITMCQWLDIDSSTTQHGISLTQQWSLVESPTTERKDLLAKYQLKQPQLS